MEKYKDYDEDEVEVEKVEEKIENSDADSEMPKNFKPDIETITAIQTSDIGRVEIKEQHHKVENGIIENINVKDNVDLGVHDIPLEKIDQSDSSINGPEDFRKVSFEDMQERFDKLENVVKPAVENGANGEYFNALDHNHDLYVKEGGYKEVYDTFYGSDPIELYQLENEANYKIDSGYHRLFVARELGIKSVPARVKKI